MQVVEQLERGREACARGAWVEAHEALAKADEAGGLGPEDLALLAMAAFMLGREDDYVAHLERAHLAQFEASETLAAARTAFWIGMHLLTRGEAGRGGGWIGRAQRLIEGETDECVERAYVLLPLAFRRQSAGDFEEAGALAREAAAIAQRYGDQDLFALAVHAQGQILINGGHAAEGLPLLDEAMIAVTTGAVSPIATGIVYCGVIHGCQHAFEARRAREWTAALARWCERQPDMIAFSGRCHVHRAEIMQLEGAWSEAIEEARCAAERAARGGHRTALAEAAYVQGEVHRLRGEADAAEAAYREASGHGREPQPGLALLRLAQGKVEAAVTAMRRVLGETTRPAARARLLPACVEISVAAGDLDGARTACEELAGIAAGHDGGLLGAIVAQAQGTIELAAGEPAAALIALRHAWRGWEDIDAPYEAARVRALMGAACRALGDEEAAALELEAARRTFASLGAAPDLARIDEDGGASPHGLTAREREVLRLVADGRTNKAIAAELVLSERTVDRHVSNIFAKLGVSSRAAATAFAYEHQLV
jgi:DNA-binding NarL/FixJ family response regulator